MRAFLFDLDGTLYQGDAAIPGAVDAVRALADRGVPYRFVTNTTRMSRLTIAARLAAMGFPAPVETIFTPALAAARWLRERAIERVALCVPDVAREDFAGFTPDDGAPEAVVVGDLGEAWTFAALNRAFAHVLNGATLVALHKNRYWLTPAGLTIDAGAFVAALEYATGQEAVVVGKPSAEFFLLAARSLGADADDVVMVGDDAESDVAGAQAAGLMGALVRTGKFSEDELRRTGVRPDAVLESAARVLELL